jgi:hypothetical protein
MELIFPEDGVGPPEVADVTSRTLLREGVESFSGYRITRVLMGDRDLEFGTPELPSTPTGLCTILPELGNNKSELVRFRVRKPDGQAFWARVPY